MTASVLESVSRLSASPASTSADRVRSSAACTAATIVAPTLPLAPNTPTRMAFTLDGAAPARLIRAIHRFREADHRRDVVEVNAFRAQGGVDILGKPVGRRTIPAIDADLVPHIDDVGVLLRRPDETEATQFGEEFVVVRGGARNRSVSNQDCTNHYGHGESGQPAR